MKKKKVVALSSLEAELGGIVQGITKVLCLRKLLNELGFHQVKECEIYCDNKAVSASPRIQYNMKKLNI